MRCQDSVEAVEHALVEKRDLSPQNLFGRTADDGDFAGKPELGGNLGRDDGGGAIGGPDVIVAAGMAGAAAVAPLRESLVGKTGKRVIFRKNREARAAARNCAVRRRRWECPRPCGRA